MSKTLTVQENIRLSPDFKIRFDRAIKRGCYNKSHLIRSLMEAWVKEQEQSQ